MADTTNMLQQQQQAQAAEAARQAQKAAKPETQKPATVQFSQVMRDQQKKKGDATVTVLQSNPVGGAEVVKNAISGKNKLAVAANANTSGTSGTSGTTTGSTSSSSVDGSLTSSGSGSQQQLLNATYQMQEMNQDFNLQYLGLQEGVQADSRQYTAASNVSKTRSDTAKNSLSNVK